MRLNIKNIDGTWYELVDQAEATGLVSNGKWIEGELALHRFITRTFSCGYTYMEDALKLGAQPARPLTIPDGEYDLEANFTEEEFKELVPGCWVQCLNSYKVVLPADSEGKIVMENDGRYLIWNHIGVTPADNATAFIIGRSPKVEEVHEPPKSYEVTIHKFQGTSPLANALRNSINPFSGIPRDKDVWLSVTVKEVEESPAPVDLGPLTEEEWERLRVGDKIHFKSTDGDIKQVNAIELDNFGNRVIRWLFTWSFEEGPWFPSEATARRLRGEKYLANVRNWIHAARHGWGGTFA